ncbi:MAG: methyltransferase domain-containing protein, partial [Deltaproteobacteria bacterium]|nr:methyltransferase domain-containing protein [Deltaproteobacteria bacterium]
MSIDPFLYDIDLYRNDPFASRVNARRLKLAMKLVRNLVTRYELKSILDIGSGEGYFVKEVYRDLSSTTLTLLEPEAKRLEELFHRFSGTIKVRAVMEAIPFSGECFDLVVIWTVLDHVKNISKALHETARVLRPGGRVLIGGNNFWHHRSYEVPDDSGHWHAFSARALH